MSIKIQLPVLNAAKVCLDKMQKHPPQIGRVHLFCSEFHQIMTGILELLTLEGAHSHDFLK